MLAAFVALNAVFCACTVNRVHDKMIAGAVTIAVAIGITTVVYVVRRQATALHVW